MELTEKEQEVVKCMANCWIDCDYPLYGDLCYQDAIDLFIKLGVPSLAEGTIRRLSEIEKQENCNG